MKVLKLVTNIRQCLRNFQGVVFPDVFNKFSGEEFLLTLGEEI